MANKKRNPLEIYEKMIEDDYFFATAAADWEKPSIIIHGKDNKKILEITYEGEVIWHAEDAASEAAEESRRQAFAVRLRLMRIFAFV